MKDFMKTITRKANIPTLIYLILNVLLISYVLKFLLEVIVGDKMRIHYWQAFLIGLAVYAVSLAIALSPFGEWILRKRTGCRKIKRAEQMEFITPIFQEVYAQAKAADPTIPDDVKLFINNDPCPNAFATGKKTICITEGLLFLPEVQIKATLAHEFGHIAHRDTSLLLVITVGNMMVTAIIFVLGIIADFFLNAILSLGHDDRDDYYYHDSEGILLATFLAAGAIKLWTWIGLLFVRKSSRENEYEADAFSYRLGYGNALCAFLDTVDEGNLKGLFATLVSTHPDKNYRIAKLQELGATYRTNAIYGDQ